MNIEEAMTLILQAPEEAIIVAKPPFTWGSEAKFAELQDDMHFPGWVKNEGYEYLLGREDVMHLLDDLKTKKVSSKTIAEFVIHYAVIDCTPEWINDIPDL